MTSKLKTDVLETVSGSGTIALTNQLSGMTSASLPSGTVLQVVYANVTSGNLTTSSTSYVDTSCAASITPTSSSSKILVQANAHVYVDNNTANNWSAANFDITRGGTQVFESSPGPTTGYTFGRYTTDANLRNMGLVPITYLDSPSTTSAVIYRLRVASRSGYNIQLNTGFGHHNITLIEIAG
tara:strand:- start:32 stop:580 length:549 start_codon:yes stop_codon:yes gene_type:complete